MAIDIRTEMKTITVKERTCKIEIDLIFGSEPSIVITREQIEVDKNGDLLSQGSVSRQVKRKLRDLSSGEKILELIELNADTERLADVAAFKANAVSFAAEAVAAKIEAQKALTAKPSLKMFEAVDAAATKAMQAAIAAADDATATIGDVDAWAAAVAAKADATAAARLREDARAAFKAAGG